MSVQRQDIARAFAIVGAILCLVWFHPRAVLGGGTIPQAKQAAMQNSAAEPLNTWNGLIPLKSTRADVERLFGKPKIMIGSAPLYEFDKENVIFTYAVGGCEQLSWWNVPRDTILDIEIIPQGALSVKDTGFDLTKFSQYKTEHPELLIYVNKKEGVTIRTKTIGIPNAVVSIKLEGASRDLALACPPSVPPKRQ